MSDLINKINSGALALRNVRHTFGNLPPELASPFSLSKAAPYFGFVDISIGGVANFVMFSNNDDFVVKNFFWNGADAYEPMSLKIWLAFAKNSSVVFDVGSYSGIYSLAAASQNRKCKVYSFEAIDSVYYRLLINKMANSFANIEMHNLAVCDNDAGAEFNVYAGESVLSTGSTMIEKDRGREVFCKKRVRSSSLDMLVDNLKISSLDLLKIDAEGAEHLVFGGGRKILQRFRPDIICEFLKDSRIDEIDSILRVLGYKYFHINEKLMKIQAVESIAADGDMDSLNTLITTKPEIQVKEIFAAA
jgi:FkbM family methyltransferase